jgi:hypothetical protein
MFGKCFKAISRRRACGAGLTWVFAVTLGTDDLVAGREGDIIELTRGQETELPQALKWQVARADEDYDAALVEARRITVDTTRIASESFPMAVPPEEAERRCRRALMEAWTGRETAAFRLPPSRLALDPADVVTLEHDGRQVPLRLVSIADAEARGIEAVRQDREAHDLPPGSPRQSSLSKAVVFGAPEVVLMDLPQLTEDQPQHRPFIAAHATPWPGEMAVFRSPSTDGFEPLTTFGGRARIGTLVSDFYAGPTSRFDLGNALVVDLLSGTLESVTDLTLFGGANALAIESVPGTWEIVQAGAAELIAPSRYRMTRLLRGQRGTEVAMADPAPAGARVVMLDSTLASLPIAEADLGLPWNWRIGPASRSVSDETYVAQAFTPVGVGLRPFSVAHVEQPWRKPRTPGAANPFSAKLNAALWTAKTTAEGGTGDLFYTMNKEAAGDDLGLTLQTNFVTKALVGMFGSDRFRLAVSDDGSTFFDGLTVDNGTGIVEQPQLPRFKAWTNYDNYVGVGTWTKIDLNNTDYNDQGAFDAGTNLFTAPVDGTYSLVDLSVGRDA